MKALAGGGVIGKPAAAAAWRALVSELGEGADLSMAAEALPAADEMTRHPRSTWASPTDAWERTVVALAVALLRTEGGLGCSRGFARRALAEALEDLAARGVEERRG